MRQKFIFAMTVAMCCALAIAPAMANERTVDRFGDNSKAAKARGANQEEAISIHPMVSRIAMETRLSGVSTNNVGKAAGLVVGATKQDRDTAIASLQRAVTMDLPETPETDKILTEAHRLLGDLYEGSPAKQVTFYAIALQHASDSGLRARLESRIADLGGDVFDIAFVEQTISNPSAVTRDPGPDDSCTGAVATGLGVGSPYSEVMDIGPHVTPSGDHNWRSFDVPAGPDGWTVRIETISDNPGTFEDDTTLELWADCPSNGGTLINANDDLPNGTDFTSLINSDLLFPGSYYVEVGGFFDTATPDNFTLELEVTDVIELPQPDSFEPDNDRADANAIGHPTSIPQNANGWGRARKEIQAHSMFSPTAGGDVDHVSFDITRNELVRIGTAGQFPTFFNGFEGTGALDNPDTVIELLYENEPDYGGRCNQETLGFLPVCFSDADCPTPLQDPVAGFPPCIPITAFVAIGTDRNPLAVNDDRGGGDFGSELLLCLPRSKDDADSLYDATGWVVRVNPFSASDLFDYEVQVKNEVSCNYEVEPNNDFADATPLTLGDTVHGIYDFVSTNPFSDADLYSWDVDEEAVVSFETLGYDSLAVDTGLELYVGPDDSGAFFDTGVSDDDGGSGFLSALSVIVPPASQLLGNTTADADYFLNVTSFFYNPNYPYTLTSDISAVPAMESEPNDTCGTANTIELGDAIAGSIGAACDYDSYKLTLTGDTFVTIATDGAADTAIELRDCSDDSVLACDDDSGPGLLSLVDGCLPAGDYCARVRAFQSGTGTYEISATGTGGCVPTDPPSVSGDGAFTCTDYDTCP